MKRTILVTLCIPQDLVMCEATATRSVPKPTSLGGYVSWGFYLEGIFVSPTDQSYNSDDLLWQLWYSYVSETEAEWQLDVRWRRLLDQQTRVHKSGNPSPNQALMLNELLKYAWGIRNVT